MLTVVVIIALCGTAAGFLFGRSELLADRRELWARARDVLDAMLHDELDVVDPPYGSIAVDTRVLPRIPMPATKRDRRRWRWSWRWRYALCCNVCGGWWGCGLAYGVWAAVAALTGSPQPVHAAEVIPVVGAAFAVHTALTGAGNRLGVW